jgi:hypothetical protein
MIGLMKSFRTWLREGYRRDEIDRLGPSEASRIATDVGVSVTELGDLVTEGPDSAALLPRRLHAQHLDTDRIVRMEPATMRDMQRVCSHCADKGRCEHDLETNPDGEDWKSYCPNAETIRALS